MFFLYFTPFITSFFLSFALTWFLIRLTKNSKFSFLNSKRNYLNRNVSRFAGAAIISSFLFSIILIGDLRFDNLKIGMALVSILILLCGIIDDIKNLSWKKQFFIQAIAAIVMIISGLQIDYIANPFGGAEIRLDSFTYSMLGNQYSVLGSIFILFLIIGFMNIVNWLDGQDGLAGGVGFIGFASLFFLSISSLVNQPPLGIISIAAAGSIFGFLLFNIYPAKIHMGTSGAMFIGFLLAVISIFSGAKLATLALVFSIPIIDAFWVIIRRIKNNKSIFKGDKTHLHFRLKELGFSENQIVFLYCAISVFFGFIALKLSGLEKIIAFIIFSAIVILFVNFIESYLNAAKIKKI